MWEAPNALLSFNALNHSLFYRRQESGGLQNPPTNIPTRKTEYYVNLNPHSQRMEVF